jgi:hypothetical protein
LSVDYPLPAVRYLHRPAFGFDWLSFPGVRGGVYFHNPFSIKRLHSFVLLQIGFVFSKSVQIPSRFSTNSGPIAFELFTFALSQIGFVFSNKW